VGRAQSFANLGFSMITPDLGMAALQRVLAADRSATGVFGLDARQWFQSFPTVGASSLFSEFRDTVTVPQGGDSPIRTELDALDASQRPAHMAAAIAGEIRAVLRSDKAIDHNEAMNSVGLDSLMALELRNRLEVRLGITLPAALVWAYPTISGLAVGLVGRMGYAAAGDTTITGSSDVEPTLSEEELELLSGVVDASELEAMTGAES
jgi:phthiocerol/phenolphthiocerol synthesis type-I polyketide synthase C